MDAQNRAFEAGCLSGLSDEAIESLESFFGEEVTEIPLVAYSDTELAAIDRLLGLKKDDVLLCEADSLLYALYALEKHPDLSSVQVYSSADYGFDRVGILSKGPKASEFPALELIETMPRHAGPIKLLASMEDFSFLDEQGFIWPAWENPALNKLADGTGSIGVLRVSRERVPRRNYAILGCNASLTDCVRAIEFSDGLVLLEIDEFGSGLVLEDLSDEASPWIHKSSSLEIAANNYCLAPSEFRRGVAVLEETTLGALTTRITRGTALSGKSLKTDQSIVVKESLDVRVLPQKGRRRVLISSDSILNVPGSAWRNPTPDEQYYYVDDSCFREGGITPKVLASMPKGQERYTVNEYDGEVILVSRNSKQVAVYAAARPTLIANSVYAIRLDTDLRRDYLACWMRSDYAKSWFYNDGRVLSKGLLSSLPIPLLNEHDMGRVVECEKALALAIAELYSRLDVMKSRNRFNPFAEPREQGRLAARMKP